MKEGVRKEGKRDNHKQRGNKAKRGNRVSEGGDVHRIFQRTFGCQVILMGQKL